MTCRNWIVAALAFVFLNSTNLAISMTVSVQGNQVFATGPVADDLRKFEDAFGSAVIDTVVFVNSPGGDLWTALRVGRLIAAKGYKTVIAGYCISACSIMFMGGRERQFSDAWRPNQTYIGIHGEHYSDTGRVDSTLQPQIFAFYKQNMGDNFNATIMNQALYDMKDAGALLRVSDPARSLKNPPMHCNSSQTPREKCTVFADQNAQNLGVVTSADLLKLDIPEKFRENLAVLGVALTEPILDMQACLTDLAERQCPGILCKTNITGQAKGRPEHKAIAVPSEGKGFGYSWGRDTAVQAVVSSIYQCNHRKDYPVRLCEPEIVDGFSLRPLYAAAKLAHLEAVKKTVPPVDKYFANEEYGGGLTTASGFRTEKFSDITPQKLDGIQTVANQELALQVASGSPPVVLEVSGAFNELIPGSETLGFRGLAFEDASKDALYEKRFDNLLKLIVPDSASSIVFYCTGRNSWLAVNAALRAKKLGYGTVKWYRGGIESWRAAALPLAPATLRAVVNFN